MLYGYARVSTAFEKTKDRNQTFDRQIEILKQHGILEENIYSDRITGGSETSERIGYADLMNRVMAGDTIYVTEMSRFSRSLQDLISSCETLMKKQIGVVFLKERIEIGTDGLSPMNKFIFQLFGAFNEFEKSLIASRVKEGMAAAKANGTKLGRPSRLKDDMIDLIKFDYLSGSTYDELQEKYGVTRPSLAKICKPLSKERKEKKAIATF